MSPLARAAATIAWNVAGETGREAADLSTHRLAAQYIITLLKKKEIEIDVVGHSFVHGGTLFDRSVKIDPDAMARLRQCLHFAPIYNPKSFSVIETCLEQLPGVPQYAVFDTAFHAGMPEVSRQYALPRALAEKFGFRKFGFHGLSYQFVSNRMAELMEKPLETLKLILCHLGTGGSSVTAMKDGKSLDTSMGYSPLAGLVMSTRSGDIDAEIVLEMIRQGLAVEEVSEILNNQSGLIGLSGFSSSLPEIIEEAGRGNANCQMAYDVYTHRLKTYLGAFTWLLNGADAIVFTDEVGLRAWQLRERACNGVENLGIEIDPLLNQKAPADRASRISSARSKTQIQVMPTDEEVVMVREILALI